MAKIKDLFKQVEEKKIILPNFQREFVWERDQQKNLLASLFTSITIGSVLFLEYEKDGKKENFQYSVAQDWVKYPLKEPTKFLKVDWEPFVQYVKERQ